jgi:hypothetical protein
LHPYKLKGNSPTFSCRQPTSDFLNSISSFVTETRKYVFIMHSFKHFVQRTHKSYTRIHRLNVGTFKFSIYIIFQKKNGHFLLRHSTYFCSLLPPPNRPCLEQNSFFFFFFLYKWHSRGKLTPYRSCKCVHCRLRRLWSCCRSTSSDTALSGNTRNNKKRS